MKTEGDATAEIAGGVDGSFEKYRKLTHGEKFLAEMERVVPWACLIAADRTTLSEGKKRTPFGRSERMLRI